MTELILADAAQIVNMQTSPTPMLAVFVVGVIAIVLGIVFAIRKLHERPVDILKSCGLTLLIAILLEVGFCLIAVPFGFFMIFCKMGVPCPGPFQTCFGFTRYLLPGIFLLVLAIIYGIKVLRGAHDRH
jgi:hypothetical protein